MSSVEYPYKPNLNKQEESSVLYVVENIIFGIGRSITVVTYCLMRSAIVTKGSTPMHISKVQINLPEICS